MSGQIQTTLNISEAQLEEFFVQSCDHLIGFKVLDRQMRLDCGIVDVFCYEEDDAYYVVELKAEPLRSKHLAQVLSYTCELRAKHPHKIIRPLLIGPTLEDQHLLNCINYHGSEFNSTAVCEYRLYSFDALRGINFSWVSNPQRQAEEKRHEWAYQAQEKLRDAGRQRDFLNADLTAYRMGRS
jgi:hypothetical protein